MRLMTIIATTFMALTFVAASGQAPKDTILKIDQQVQEINQNTNYKKVTLTNREFLDEQFIKQPGEGYGQLTGWLNRDTIYKIIEFMGIRKMNDFATTEYYFHNGKLIYVSETEDYGPDILMDSAGTVDHKVPGPDFEGRYYFTNNKLIKTIAIGQQKILPNEKYFESQSKEGQLLQSAQKFMLLFKI